MKRTLLFALAAVTALGVLAVFVYYRGRPAPVEMREEIYPCVVYYRKTHLQPRPMIAHIVTVDLTCKNIRVLVTPPEKGDKQNPLRARTTSAFAREFGVQIAINGDGFTPWWSNNLFDYYPPPGRPGASARAGGFQRAAVRHVCAQTSHAVHQRTQRSFVWQAHPQGL